MSQISLFSEIFCNTSLKDHFVVRPSRDLWERWIQENFDSSRLFLRIRHPFLGASESGKPFLVSVGDPVSSEYQNAIFLPMWMIDTNQYEGCGEKADFEIVLPDELPRAERIVLRPVEYFFTELDVVSELEKSFSRLGVLQQGMMYQIPLEQLGGLKAEFYVEILEPAEEVYLDGDEIPLEFEQSVESFLPKERVPTPPPPPPVRLDEADFMVPTNFLAGAIPPPGPSRPQARRTFVPFSGAGHVLGGGGGAGSASGSSKKL